MWDDGRGAVGAALDGFYCMRKRRFRFADAERPCDFVVVAVLVDLFGNLEFAVCEVAGVFQAGEGLFEVVGLGQAVGNLVEDGV